MGLERITQFSLSGYRFGTILVNLESHRVVDALADRRAETAAQWIHQQPDVMVVSHDRGGEYASAATEGVPQAVNPSIKLVESVQLFWRKYLLENKDAPLVPARIIVVIEPE